MFHIFQLYTVDLNNADDCAAKFRSNSNLGFFLFLSIVAGTLLRTEKAVSPPSETEDKEWINADLLLTTESLWQWCMYKGWFLGITGTCPELMCSVSALIVYIARSTRKRHTDGKYIPPSCRMTAVYSSWGCMYVYALCFFNRLLWMWYPCSK